MLLWICIVALTAAAVLAVVTPLLRAGRADRRNDQAARVYIDQIAELERDVESRSTLR